MVEKEKKFNIKQKNAKAKADELLEKLLEEHALWIKNGENKTDAQRLSWKKIQSVFQIYKVHGLGIPDLSGKNMTSADFSKSEFPERTCFKQSILDKSDFSHSKLFFIDMSECALSSCNFSGVEAEHCCFVKSTLTESKFIRASFVACNFNNTLAQFSHFEITSLDTSSFVSSSLVMSTIVACSAIRTNFSEANLLCASLIRTNFKNANLTGSVLHGTARSNWNIEGVECSYSYWDEDGKKRFPPDRLFEEGEFTNQYRDYKEFSYTFKEGITPLDLMLATHIVEEINKADMGFRIKIDNASLRGLNPTLNFIMESGAEKSDEAQHLFKTIYEQKIELLEVKLRNSEQLLAERTRRADLAEEQLSEMTAVVKQTFSGEKFGMNARQLLVEHLFAPVMEEVFREDGLIAQYAASKSKGIASLDADDLARYRYVALFGAGRHEPAISGSELDLVRTSLSRFMKDECLMIPASELRNAPEDCYIRSIYRMFAPPSGEAFVAIATVHAGINDNILKRPVYHELEREEDESWDFALNRALEKLRASLSVKSIRDFSLPALPSKKQSLVCPNGNLIRKLRENIGSQDRACEIKAYRNEQESFFLSKNTLIKAEKGEPITKSKLDDIAKVLKTAPSRLVFDPIVPNRERLKELREAVFCTEEELLEQFGVSTPVFFDLLLQEKAVPADTLRYVHHHYKRLIGSKADPFVKLVDVPATEALAG